MSQTVSHYYFSTDLNTGGFFLWISLHCEDIFEYYSFMLMKYSTYLNEKNLSHAYCNSLPVCNLIHMLFEMYI